MAIGLGHLFNFTLPKNFDEPYKKNSIKEFWRSWHITLTSWFREFVFLRVNKYSFYISILITFILSGIWHGVGYSFICWGIYHGLIYILCNYFESKNFLKIKNFIKVMLVNIFIMLAWPLFDIGIEKYAYSLLNFNFTVANFYFPINKYFSIFFILFILLFIYGFNEKKFVYLRNEKKNFLFYKIIISPYFFSLLFALTLLLIDLRQTFIYFRF